MKLIQTFSQPIYQPTTFDGGPKKEFIWTLDYRRQGQDSEGKFIRVGSYDANTWFNVPLEKTERDTLAHAARRLGDLAARAGKRCTFTYQE